MLKNLAYWQPMAARICLGYLSVVLVTPRLVLGCLVNARLNLNNLLQFNSPITENKPKLPTSYRHVTETTDYRKSNSFFFIVTEMTEERLRP